MHRPSYREGYSLGTAWVASRVAGERSIGSYAWYPLSVSKGMP